jgi:hypothetical protein
MTRYYGIFANRSKYRSRLPRPPTPENEQATDEEPEAEVAASDQESSDLQLDLGLTCSSPNPSSNSTALRPRRLPWAALLRRTFSVDALRCEKCSSQMVVLAFLTDPAVVEKILTHLGLPAVPPALSPARLDPQCDFVVDVTADDSWPVDEPSGDVDVYASPRGPPRVA